MKTFAIVLLSVALFSCNKYVVHPGSINTADSVAYDALRDAQAVIDTARPQLESGALSAGLKPLFNRLVDAYNVAHPAWQAYHDGKTADASALNADLASLSAALAAFRKGN